MRSLRPATLTPISAAVVASIALSLSGCSHTVTVGSARTVRLAVSEYRVVPQSIHATPGLLTIVVENDGRLTHNLVVSENGVTVGQTQPLAPGGEADLALSLPPGKYLMRSSLFADQALGVYGTLTVGR